MKLRQAVKELISPTTDAQAQEPAAPEGMCEAHGCPELGTISPNTRQGGPWYCRWHFAAPNPKLWPKITQERCLANGFDTTP